VVVNPEIYNGETMSLPWEICFFIEVEIWANAEVEKTEISRSPGSKEIPRNVERRGLDV